MTVRSCMFDTWPIVMLFKSPRSTTLFQTLTCSNTIVPFNWRNLETPAKSLQTLTASAYPVQQVHIAHDHCTGRDPGADRHVRQPVAQTDLTTLSEVPFFRDIPVGHCRCHALKPSHACCSCGYLLALKR
jgi:hypothetical protein